MAQLSNPTIQTIEAGQNAVFTSSFITPQEFGIILPNSDTSSLFLRGVWVPRRFLGCGCGWRDFFAEFYASFSANIQIPSGGTVGEISVAITVNGEPIQTSRMIATPAAVEEFANISTQVFVPIPRGSVESLAVENTSDQAIQMQNANLTVFMPGSQLVR